MIGEYLGCYHCSVAGAQQWDFAAKREDLGWWEPALLWQMEGVVGAPAWSSLREAHQGLTQPIQQLEGSGTVEITSFQREITNY